MELIEVFEGDSSYYLVFELLRGLTLHKYVKLAHASIPEDYIRSIIKV